MELVEKYTKVITKTSQTEIGKVSQFILVENQRFIDINNLDKYTIKQLKSIAETMIRGAKKQHYIDYIIKHKSAKIIEVNREIKLNQLLN